MSNFLDRIIGQDKATNILSKISNSQNVPHAILFAGPHGVGKHNAALLFMQQLLHKNPLNSNLEKHITNLEEPYVKFVTALPRGRGEDREDNATSKLTKDAIESIREEFNKKVINPFYDLDITGANNIKISSIREIRKFISLDYGDIPYRFILINNAHEMNDEAQNALLKNLEEPPEGIIFILTTSDVDKLLPTILSRCQRIDFNPLGIEDVYKILTEYSRLENEQAKLLSVFADGSVSNALRIPAEDFEKLIDTSINILRYSLGRRYNTAYTILRDALDEFGNSKIYDIISIIQKWFSDVNRDRSDLKEQYFSKYRDTIKKFNNKFTEVTITEVQNNLNNFKSILDRNINLNLVAVNIIFEIGHLGIG